MLTALLLSALAQTNVDLTSAEPGTWTALEPGLDFAVFELPDSPVSDHRLRVLRADPAQFTVQLRSSVAGDRWLETATHEQRRHGPTTRTSSQP